MHVGPGGAKLTLHPTAPAQPYVPVRGTVRIPGKEAATENGAGSRCWAMGNDPTSQQLGSSLSSPFDDVKAGAQVTITSSSGDVVGVGTLGQGTAALQRDATRHFPCVFGFTVDHVPTSSRFYGVKVGSHEQQVPRAQIGSPVVDFTG